MTVAVVEVMVVPVARQQIHLSMIPFFQGMEPFKDRCSLDQIQPLPRLLMWERLGWFEAGNT